MIYLTIEREKWRERWREREREMEREMEREGERNRERDGVIEREGIEAHFLSLSFFLSPTLLSIRRPMFR